MKNLAISVVAVLLLASCFNDGSEQSAAKKQESNNTGSLSGQVDHVEHEESPGARYEAAGNPFDSTQEPQAERDDAAAEKRDEESAEEYDEYAYEEEADTSTVNIKPRSEGYVEWQTPTETPYSQAEVEIVNPDGTRTKHSFGPGEAMVLDETLPDGLYKWESVITPEIDPSVRDEMRTVRESGNFAAEQELKERLRAEGSLPTKQEAQHNRQSGAFTVRDGVAIPTSTEVDSPGEQGG